MDFAESARSSRMRSAFSYLYSRSARWPSGLRDGWRRSARPGPATPRRSTPGATTSRAPVRRQPSGRAASNRTPGFRVRVEGRARAVLLGGHAPEAERKALRNEASPRDAPTCRRAEPARRTLLIAANMGALAESVGLRQGLKYRGDIRDELLIVLKLDASFQKGIATAHSAEVLQGPGLFGAAGRSRRNLRKIVDLRPRQHRVAYFLAETLMPTAGGRQARAELQKVIDAPFDPEWTPEDRGIQAESAAPARHAALVYCRTHARLLPSRPRAPCASAAAAGRYAGSRYSSNMMLAM